MATLYNDTREHPQTGPVRFVQDSPDKGQAVWYDFHGNADVTDDWLAAHMAEVYPGTWAVTRHHAGGNGHEGADLCRVVTGPLPVWWFLDCGPWRPGMPLHWRGGDRILEPLNRDPGEYSACDGTTWYRGERCPTPRPRPEDTP